MKSNCKHCQNACLVIGKTECDKYNPKAELPEQLKKQIREAFSIGQYEKAKELQIKLDSFMWGVKSK